MGQSMPFIAVNEPPRRNAMSDNLLTEVARQKKYLAELPKEFNYPLFNTKRALDSQRQNGYRNTAVAAREIVDNAFEAGATKVEIIFDSVKSRGREVVKSVAFIDNGAGMIPQMARFSLSWGGGTHFDDPNFIGKFGFGLPNASINQTKVVEVYTRTDKKELVTKAWLDLDTYKDYVQQSVPEPVEADLPEFVQRHLKKTNSKFERGTVVVWCNPDRLTYKSERPLAEHLIDDFGVTYRYLLDDKKLIVEGTEVEPVDPLFLDPKGRYYAKPEDGGAVPVEEMTIAARYFQDTDTGALHLEIVDDPSQVSTDDTTSLAVGVMRIKIARFPYDFAGRGGDDFSDDAKRRFEIRQPRRGMSFVRAGREIETLDAFPRSKRDQANGLGKWPLLQSYAYYWGIEVAFGPEFDEVFGISNDKQRVRPIEDFWRVLTKREVDRLLRNENAWQTKTRAVEHKKRLVEKAEASDTATPSEAAAASVPVITGKRLHLPERLKPAAQENAQAEAKKRAQKSNRGVDEVLKALTDESKRRPYRIDFFDDPRGPFYYPELQGLQLVIFINRQHRFYEMCYGELIVLQGGEQAKWGIDLMLFALGKAEIEIDDPTAAQQYQYTRESKWSEFLQIAFQDLSSRVQAPDEPEAADTEAAA
jgi:hypothetical protein